MHDGVQRLRRKTTGVDSGISNIRKRHTQTHSDTRASEMDEYNQTPSERTGWPVLIHMRTPDGSVLNATPYFHTDCWEVVRCFSPDFAKREKES